MKNWVANQGHDRGSLIAMANAARAILDRGGVHFLANGAYVNAHKITIFQYIVINLAVP